MIVCGSCVIFVPILKNLVDLASFVMKNILEDLQIRTRISPTSTQPPPPTTTTLTLLVTMVKLMSTDCFLQCAKPFAFTTDNTLKVTHHNFDTKEIMIALKLHGIMSSSLLLIGLMVIGLGIYQYGNKI